MSYIRAEEVLPKELIETIQQYVNGKAIYIPSTSKKEWGSHTDTRQYLIQRNHEISQKYQGGSSIASLAKQFSLWRKVFKESFAKERECLASREEKSKRIF